MADLEDEENFELNNEALHRLGVEELVEPEPQYAVEPESQSLIWGQQPLRVEGLRDSINAAMQPRVPEGGGVWTAVSFNTPPYLSEQLSINGNVVITDSGMLSNEIMNSQIDAAILNQITPLITQISELKLDVDALEERVTADEWRLVCAENDKAILDAKVLVLENEIDTLRTPKSEIEDEEDDYTCGPNSYF